MQRIFTYIIFIWSISFEISIGQTATEAYRLSTSDPMGTARNLGVGNSMYTIGPDFSAVATNPAGLGGYGKSEFLITSGFGTTTYSSTFKTDGLTMTYGQYDKFNLPNVGFVLVNKPHNSRWNSSNWAIGMTRNGDYNRELYYTGRTLGSITDSWRENATGLDPNNLNGFEEGLAYTSGAIYDFEKDNIYESDYNLNPQYSLPKQESVFIEGGKSELMMAYGADYDQKIQFGFSVNMPFVNFTQSRFYSESDGLDDGVPFFNNLAYTSFINTTGYGWNGKFGVIIKPAKHVNLSFAAHTPTFLYLTDNFNTSVTYDYTDQQHNGPIISPSPYGNFHYGLRTPWAFAGGLGIVAGTAGFIAAGIQWTDYSDMRYEYSVAGNGVQFESQEYKVNTDIRAKYGSTVQLNLGGEFVLDKFRVRGGVTMAQSPYNNDNTFNPSYHTGLGLRENHFYMDLGYQLTMEADGYSPYETIVAPQPLVVTDYHHHQITATFGFKF